MNIEYIKQGVLTIIDKYPIKSITLFGSRATDNYREDSDIDLIFEFTEKISLLTLAHIKHELEDIFGTKVDVIHGPVENDELFSINKAVELYAA